jgi:UDP-glucose 4-epimerase
MARFFLVTGGTGFIGAALVRRLVGKRHRIRVLDDGSRGAKRRLADIGAEVEYVWGDVRDSATVARAADGVDAVVHLAAVNGTEFFYSKPELVLSVGLHGILNVIDACRRHGVGELIVASSSEVYQAPPQIPTNETVPLIIPDPLNPRYSYAGSKIATELVALNAARTDFDRMVVFRPHNVYGPDMAWEHVVPQFCLRAMQLAELHPSGDLPFPIQGDGTQSRAFTHIDDMIDGLMLVIERGAHMNIYHVGNPEETTIAEVARRIVACFGRHAALIPSDLPAGSTRRRCPDVTKLRALGFQPKISFAQGIPPVVDWHRENARLASEPIAQT